MYKQQISKFVVRALLLSALPGLMLGCDSSYQSTDDFLSELPTDIPADSEIVGSLPPMGESVENTSRIRVETEELDLGVIPHDELTHHRLKVFNDGGMPLTITRVDTTCACTQGSVTPENAKIQPGAEAWIDIVVDPRRIPGFHSRKVLTITSTDIENQSLQVGVSANVDPEFEIGPQEIAIGDIPKGEPFEKRIRFRQIVEKKVEILALDPVEPPGQSGGTVDLSTEIVPIPDSEWKEPGRPEYDLVFRLLPNMPAGPFTRYVHLDTDIRNGLNRIRLTFTGTVIAPFAVAPPSPLTLSPHDDGTYHERITISGATPLTIESMTPRDPALSATLSADSTPTEALVDIVYSSVAPVGNVTNTLLTLEIVVDGKTYTEEIGIVIRPGVGGRPTTP